MRLAMTDSFRKISETKQRQRFYRRQQIFRGCFRAMRDIDFGHALPFFTTRHGGPFFAMSILLRMPGLYHGDARGKEPHGLVSRRL